MNKRLHIVLIVLVLLLLFGCTQEETTEPPETTEATAGTETAPDETEQDATETQDESTNTEDTVVIERVSATFLDEMERPEPELPFEPAQITPGIPAYTVAADLSNVENRADFGSFTPEQQAQLTKNGFVITQKKPQNGELGYDQIFHIYDRNEYLWIPSFVTGDSMTHLFHIFYDSFLRNTEREQIYPKLQAMTERLLADSISLYETLTDEPTKEIQLRNIAFFGTAAQLLELDTAGLPAEAQAIVEQEMAHIESRSPANSATTLFDTDFSQMTPRGHYTRDDLLERYFLATMYYGQAGIYPLKNEQPVPEAVVQAMLIAHTAYQDEEVFRLWSGAVDPIDFLVEGAEDLSIREIARALYSVYGQEPDLNALFDGPRLSAVAEELLKHPEPLIDPGKGLSFRFIPQRAVMDNVLMQNLVDLGEPGKPSKRPIYSGLDVMASFGSEKAKEMQLADPYNAIWPEYPGRLQENIDNVQQMQDADWQKNLYRGWLWMLSEYTQEFGEGYPFFMQNEAWQRKDLRSALGSYTELKHDTVLYGKQVGAQRGGGGVMELPAGYVEPNLRLFEKLSWLLQYTKVQLEERDMLGEQGAKLDRFSEMIDFCIGVIKKELQNEALTEEEKDRLMNIGGEMEYISTRFVETDTPHGIAYWWEIESETDRRMPIVADLMRTVENECNIPPDHYLHVGTGAPEEIYVVYPHDGKLYLGRGGVFSYYEFLDTERLNDESWQQRVLQDNVHTPGWIEDLVMEEKSEIPGVEPQY